MDMTKTKSKSNSFGTFLETVHRGTAKRGESVGNPLELTTILAGSGPMTVPELLRSSEMGFIDFAKSLDTLREAKLVALVGEPGQETVELTSNGEQVAHLSQ